MALQAKIPIISTPQIASYDFTELASGLGYVLFYGTVSTPVGVKTYNLMTNQLEPGNSAYANSEDHERSSNLRSASPPETITKTFTTSQFNSTKIVDGTAIVNFTVDTGTGATNQMPATGMDVSILKNSTTLVTTNVGVQLSGNGVAATYNLTMDVPQTIFKKGDTLAVKTSVALIDTQSVYFEHDPLNRDRGATGNRMALTATTNPTAFRVYIPFKILQ